MNDEVYQLRHDLDRIRDAAFLGEVLPFDGSDLFPARLLGTQPFDRPVDIFINADFEVLATTDLPYVNLGDSVMSRAMVDTLLKVSHFEHEAIPIVMVDDTAMTPFGSDGRPQPGVETRRDYVALHLREYADVFDRDESIFEVHDFITPGMVGFIERLVLRSPPTGFPALFRIAEATPSLFVSGAARSALEAAGIGGFFYEPVEVSG